MAPTSTPLPYLFSYSDSDSLDDDDNSDEIDVLRSVRSGSGSSSGSGSDTEQMIDEHWNRGDAEEVEDPTATLLEMVGDSENVGKEDQAMAMQASATDSASVSVPDPQLLDSRFDFGFIVTRHVNSQKTNEYWNQCVKMLRLQYPFREIVIIDDNSDPQYVHAHADYSNVTIYASDFPKRGELLPYLYYLKYKWWRKAIIIHDSVFFHQRIPFERIKAPVVSLWHHPYDRENYPNLVRIAKHLNKSNALVSRLSVALMATQRRKQFFNISFGCQSVIQLSFLEGLQRKYNLMNLARAIHCRVDRCGLERIMGLLFAMECPSYAVSPSLFGDIRRHHLSFSYHYDAYMHDVVKRSLTQPVVKVWTGR